MICYKQCFKIVFSRLSRFVFRTLDVIMHIIMLLVFITILIISILQLLHNHTMFENCNCRKIVWISIFDFWFYNAYHISIERWRLHLIQWRQLVLRLYYVTQSLCYACCALFSAFKIKQFFGYFMIEMKMSLLSTVQ